jgi:hypothetical protein
MTREQQVRAFVSPLALLTRGPRQGPFALFEKYGKRRKVGGPYHTVAALERAVERRLERMGGEEINLSE